MADRSRPFLAITSTLALVAGLTSCSGPPTEGDVARASAITTEELPELGDVLVDGEGSVLYIFEPDRASAVSCTFTCASNWPPLRAIDDSPPAAGDGIDADLLGAISGSGGDEVVTYNGWPLYRYAADQKPGDHRGHDINLNGGLWYVMQPDGEPMIP